jgi:hypothetical protein
MMLFAELSGTCIVLLPAGEEERFRRVIFFAAKNYLRLRIAVHQKTDI